MSSETWTNPPPAIRSSASRIARSMPMRSISLIVNTRTPASRSSRRSPSSSWRVPDERDPSRIDRRQRPGVAREPLAREAERGRERHPVDVPARARLGRVDVRVGVDPEHAARPVHRGEPAERPERDRVVAAEDERHRSRDVDLGDDRAAMRSHVSLISGRKRARSSRAPSPRARRLSTLPWSRTSYAEAPTAAPRAPRTGSPTAPCRRHAGPGRGRAPRR